MARHRKPKGYKEEQSDDNIESINGDTGEITQAINNNRFP